MKEREIDRWRPKRDQSSMEDNGGQIGWVWGWSGVGWWSVAARSVTLSKRENKIGVSRTSSVLGRSRTRLVLGESGLGGDDLDGDANELPAVTMGVFFASARVRSHRRWDAILLVLQAARSRRCWGATRLVRSRVGRCWVRRDGLLVRSPCFLSLSLSLFYFPGV